MSDSLTLVLDGTVTLQTFADAVRGFQALVDALSHEVAGPDAQIEWVISALQAGSAITTVRGLGKSLAVVDNVVRAYDSVGEALERSLPVPFSENVQARALTLLKVVGDGIESLRFETENRDAVIRPAAARGVVLPFPVAPEQVSGYGAVEGIVETLSHRGGLRFTLYDILHDKPVSCYLVAGHEDDMRSVWGKRAIVSGRVRRDPLTGRPVSVRQIAHVEPLPEGHAGDWRRARGAAPAKTDVSPEAAIRAARDA